MDPAMSFTLFCGGFGTPKLRVLTHTYSDGRTETWQLHFVGLRARLAFTLSDLGTIALNYLTLPLSKVPAP